MGRPRKYLGGTISRLSCRQPSSVPLTAVKTLRTWRTSGTCSSSGDAPTLRRRCIRPGDVLLKHQRTIDRHVMDIPRVGVGSTQFGAWCWFLQCFALRGSLSSFWYLFPPWFPSLFPESCSQLLRALNWTSPQQKSRPARL